MVKPSEMPRLLVLALTDRHHSTYKNTLHEMTKQI